MKSIREISKDELRIDYQKICELAKQIRYYEEKYKKLDIHFGTIYGIEKSIVQELGRRVLDN